MRDSFSACAWLMFPLGSRACAVQLAPAVVVARMAPYVDVVMVTVREAGGLPVADAVTAAVGVGVAVAHAPSAQSPTPAARASASRSWNRR